MWDSKEKKVNCLMWKLFWRMPSATKQIPISTMRTVWMAGMKCYLLQHALKCTIWIILFYFFFAFHLHNISSTYSIICFNTLVLHSLYFYFIFSKLTNLILLHKIHRNQEFSIVMLYFLNLYVKDHMGILNKKKRKKN